MTKLRFPVGVVLLGILLTSCATKVEGLKVAQSFNYPSLKASPVSIGGVTAHSPTFDAKDTLAFSELLRTRLNEKRKDLNVNSFAKVQSSLGKSLQDKVLKEFKDTSDLSAATLTEMEKKLKGTRYVIFTQIESYDESKNKTEESVKDSAGKEIPGQKKIIAVSKRDVRASFHIFDLKEKSNAWNGVVSKSLSNSKDYIEKEKKADNSLVGLVKAIKGTEDKEETDGDKKYPYPEVPKLSAVMKDVFDGMIENLPEGE